MKHPLPPPAGGGKPVLNFSHPPWPCLGSGWSRSITPVPWPLTHSVTWVRRRKKKRFLPLTPPKRGLGIFRHCDIGISFVQISPLQPASRSPRWGHGNGCQLPWARSKRCPLPPGGPKGTGRGVGEPKGCLSPLASQAWLQGPGGLLGDLRFSLSPSLMLRSDLNTCCKLIVCICAF